MQKLSMKDGTVDIFIDFRVRIQYQTPALSVQQDRMRKEIQNKVNSEIKGFEEYCAEEMRKRPLPDEAISQGMKIDETEKTLDRVIKVTNGVKIPEPDETYLVVDYESYSRLLDSANKMSLAETISKMETFGGWPLLVVDKPYPFVRLLMKV